VSRPHPRPKLDAAAAELRRDHRRPNVVIARIVNCGENTVAQARAELEATGVVPAPHISHGQKTAAVRAELCRDPAQPNRVIAARVGCAPSTVAKARGRLKRDGVIVQPPTLRERIIEAAQTWTGQQQDLAARLGVHASYVSRVLGEERDRARVRAVAEKGKP